MENCIYTLPTTIFTNNVIGKDGAGMLAGEYIKNSEIPKVTGTKKINEIIKHINI